MTTRLIFPDGFEWGTATSAYQIEGAAGLDGRTPSIWDDFCARPGAIHDGSSGAVAIDHYHRYAQDIATIAGLGLTRYRFSISWSRAVRPDGAANPAGLDFYSRLVDTMLGQGIRPWVTLYHWDLPSHLDGGWTARDTAVRFAEYAELVHDRLGDRVETWTTLNEPWCSAFLGHGSGEHAPGRQDPGEALTAAHHLLLGHGLAVQALRARGAREVGITLNFSPVVAADPTRAEDLDVARRVDGLANRFFVEPLLHGAYPADVVTDAAGLWPVAAVRDGDLATIAAPIDVLGVNYYSTWAVRAPGEGDVGESRPGASPHVTAPEAVAVQRALPRTAMGWEVDPDGLYGLLTRLQRDYTGPAGVPLYITENGAAYEDDQVVGGVVQDHDRIEYLRAHLAAAHRAIADGVDLRGYFLWSVIDNFEWAHGYGRRFGLFRVDAELARHPKLSAGWYRQVATTGSVDPEPASAKMGS